MRCPICKHADTKVVDSRAAGDTLRRRRECLKCEKRFTTYERVEHATFLVVKKDNSREPYSRDKLKLGMTRSCEKLPISSDKIEDAVTRIEQSLLEERKGEVTSRMIGELVMRELRKIDKVAYIRFAAVYREFADLGDFEEELSKLLRKTHGKGLKTRATQIRMNGR